MTYIESTAKSREEMLWFVHDNMMNWLTKCREETISTDKKLELIMFGIADLSKALAGGYRKGGIRE